MKKLIGILTLSLIIQAFFPKAFNLTAQPLPQEKFPAKKNGLLPPVIRLKTSYSKIKGEQYLQDSWQDMTLFLKEPETEVKNLKGKINIYDKTVELKHNAKVMYVPVSMIRELTLNHSKYISHISLPPQSPEGFYRLIYSENSLLLCHYSSAVLTARYNRALDIGINYDEAVIETDYYILQDNKLLKLPKSRRKLLSMFSEIHELKKYIRSERIDPDNEFDLLKLINYIDTR